MIHPSIFRACTWGCNTAILVAQFLASLRWPNISWDGKASSSDVGITWYELAIAFVVCTGTFLLVWLGNGHRHTRPFPYHSVGVQSQPVARRFSAPTGRVLASDCSLPTRFLSRSSLSKVCTETYILLNPFFWRTQKYTTTSCSAPPFHPDFAIPDDCAKAVFFSDLPDDLSYDVDGHSNVASTMHTMPIKILMKFTVTIN